ncbi:hypothetical protein [Burkholderia sp. IMCC1007]|uniref:hypothetical protein n=1 Tax=Burkholderia sp. IMCC1007 TaxID=3004104 RepID=UPI0022B4973A|nr:hypothetical protein [Burkholderia sp. IMCC1007]
MIDDRKNEIMEELKRYVQDVDRQNKRLIAASNELKKSLSQRYSEIGQLVRLLEERERELDRKERDIALYKKRLEKIKETVSWKITAPLRKIDINFLSGSRGSELKRGKKIIERSGLFDSDWYLREYPDVAESGQDPILHYLIFGAKEGRRPSANFMTTFDPDGVSSEGGENPLLAFIAAGKKQK